MCPGPILFRPQSWELPDEALRAAQLLQKKQGAKTKAFPEHEAFPLS